VIGLQADDTTPAWDPTAYSDTEVASTQTQSTCRQSMQHASGLALEFALRLNVATDGSAESFAQHTSLVAFHCGAKISCEAQVDNSGGGRGMQNLLV
jgi:hypothetical protein